MRVAATLSFLTAFFSVMWDLPGADWPQFRGPRASGLDTNSALPVRWDVKGGENMRWQTKIPGLAHSCPIIRGDRIYITTAVAPVEAKLKVGLYGDIESEDESAPQQWRLLA